MREPLKDRARLEHILEAIDNVSSYIDGQTLTSLENDKMRYYAVVKNLEIIGEAVYKLTRSFRQKYPETHWDDITRLRHVLVHDYYRISLQTVWEIINHDLTPLRSQLVRYIEETDWVEWEKNVEAVVESAVHKSLVQTARRMKSSGYDVDEIINITGLAKDEIDEL